jgi:hypothetical protein
MFRLIGILAGSAIAIALLIVVLGLPALTPPEQEAIAEPVELPAVFEAEVVQEVALEPVIEPISEPGPEPTPEPEPAAISMTQETDPDLEALVDEVFSEREPVEENWYAFWSPFRSEIAANGFVARLQEKTGIDYRVVKVKTGVYEVAFAYTDDADIVSKLDRITTATGLDVSGS